MESKRIGIFRSATETRHFLSGEMIFKEGDPADVMYVVQSGEVEVSHQGRLVETLGEGNIFGEMSLINEEPRSATTVAKTECRLVPIDLKRFMFLVEETPYFAVQVMKIMASRIRKMLPRLEGTRPSETVQ